MKNAAHWSIPLAFMAGLVSLAPISVTTADASGSSENATQLGAVSYTVYPIKAEYSEEHLSNTHHQAKQPDRLVSISLLVPQLGAAHSISLTRDIPSPVSVADRESLIRFGPWLTDDGLSANAQQLIRAIQSAATHGLNPQAYKLDSLLRTVDILNVQERGDDNNNTGLGTSYIRPARETLRNELALQLDTSFLHLAEHLGHGTVDAQSVQFRLYRRVPEFNTEKLLERLHSGEQDVNNALAEVAPQHPEYQRLTHRMRNLLTEQSTGVQRASVQSNNNLSNTQLINDVLDIQLRLIETGDLPLSFQLGNTWEQSMRNALLRFQYRQGIAETGIPDARTRAALNLTTEQEIESIALSLERWRWMPRELGDRHVFVNIPEYRVAVRDGGETLLTMKAVVGAVEHPTPAFSEDMSYMDFNPTWTVPARITNAELIPRERRNPGYLASRNFEFLTRQGETVVTVPATQVTAEDFAKDSFPYTLRQRGGPKNALGRMKFMMPNPYAIYLHDTQSKSHFTLDDRAFSHGCIRLSHPERLARLLLDLDGHSKEYIADALKTKSTHRVVFRQPIPTHLTYMTTWVDENDFLHRRADIYKHDASLLDALRANNTLLSILNERTTTLASSDS